MKKDNKGSWIGAVLILLLMVGAVVFKLWLSYKRWEIVHSPDVDFWEYFFYTAILK